ncbi:MAG: hypothetical protein LBV47_02380 [Bacteroidales bacterium]|jgi:hypothetical protein|nr:hypothetical protein [Bacteroidales bacterium]
MPYRRLPTTDKARAKVLNTALELATKRDVNKIAFSEETLLELKQVKTVFESTLQIYKTDLKRQLEKSKNYKASMIKAALYISHFIKVLYMAVEREEIKEDSLKFYELDSFAGKIPSLNKEEELLKWGAKIIEGEQKRIHKGGNPVYSPSIALVKIKLEEFKEIAVYMQNMRRVTNISFERMKKNRVATNKFICNLWNEIEENIKSDNAKHKRQIALDYGIVYIFRRNEKKKLTANDLQTDLLFDFN